MLKSIYKLYGKKGNHQLPCTPNHMVISTANTPTHEVAKSVLGTVGIFTDLDALLNKTEFQEELLKFLSKVHPMVEAHRVDKSNTVYTEAQRKVDNLIADVVVIDSDEFATEYEIMYKNNSEKTKQEYKERGVVCIELPAKLGSDKETSGGSNVRRGITSTETLSKKLGGNA